MIAEKVFAEGVAKDIRNYLPPEYEDADFQVVQKNKNNGIQLIGVQVNLPERNASPIIYMEQFFDEIYSLFPAYQEPMWYFGHFHGNKYTDEYVMLFDDIMELKLIYK